jgi:hypothetical protein
MALRGEDQFYFHLSSDGSMDVYPTNKSSQFMISLKETIDFGDVDWEVALTSINYPYSWTNLGPSANTVLKYYLDKDLGPQEIHFPDWHCEKLEELVKYIVKKIGVNEPPEERNKEHESKRFYFKLDELKRIKISSIEPNFDIGFSDSMLRLLGLESHPNAKNFSIAAFDRRQRHRYFLDKVWKDDVMMDYRSKALQKQFHNIWDFEQLAGVVYPFLNEDSLIKTVQADPGLTLHFSALAKYMESDATEDSIIEDRDIYLDPDWIDIQRSMQDLKQRKARSVPTDVEGVVYSPQELGIARTVYHMTKLFNEKDLPSTIKAMTPGNLNPVQRMFVYLNIIKPVDFNDTAVKLLRMVNTRGMAFATTQEEFNRPVYLPLQKGKISMIQVYIADDQMHPVPFQVGTVLLTLHFRRRVRNLTASHYFI